jgi:hypothetical protein
MGIPTCRGIPDIAMLIGYARVSTEDRRRREPDWEAALS